MKKEVGKFLYWATSWHVGYVIILIALIQFYPVSVSDGQSFLQLIHPKDIVPVSTQVEGVDISHHNSTIDWETVSAQKENFKRIHFCFMKATEGGDFVDKRFKENWQNAKRVGISKGAYHFYRPNTSPEIQVRNFIQNVQLEPGDFAPVLDFEIQGGKRFRKNLTVNVKKWLVEIEKHYGVKPIIYTNLFIYNTYIKGQLDEYPLWVSQYETDKLTGFDEAKVLFWQHSQTGKTHGINGDVDFNVYLGSYLDMFAIKIKRKANSQNALSTH